MSATPYKIYQVRNKGSQQSYVYMGKPRIDSSGVDSFYPHMSKEGCADTYLFTTLVGSKNVQLTPATLTPKYTIGNSEVITDPFVHINSRFYHFRYPGIENDDPISLPPNSFIKTIRKETNGDFFVDWRKLTSDGSVLFKQGLLEGVFWNGRNFIGESVAGYHEIPVPDNVQDDLVYLKTRHYIDIVRNSIKSQSLSLIYKKYIDECNWSSTVLLKRFRGSYCIDVKDSDGVMQVGTRQTPTSECECGCIPCWEIANENTVGAYSIALSSPNETTVRQALIDKWDSYKAQVTEDAQGVEMHWLQQFEYNWFNNSGYNRFTEFPTVVSDEKTVNIKFNKFSDRQNRFYGINPKTGTREHHAMPPVKPTESVPYTYTYTNTHSVDHPQFFFNGQYRDRFATTKTKFITKGRIDDGKERVVVPPGVIFRTYKAIPGIISLYELDSPYRRPDELHFAVDNYGNILGYKNLPYPGLIIADYPVEPLDINPEIADDVKTNVYNAWQDYFSSGKVGFTDDTIIDDIYQQRIDNSYYVVSKVSISGSPLWQTPCISQDNYYINNISLIDGCGVHTYANIHSCPIWIDKDIFCSYVPTEDLNSFSNNSYSSTNPNFTRPAYATCFPEESSSSSSSSLTPSSSSSHKPEKYIIIDDPLKPVDGEDIVNNGTTTSSSLATGDSDAIKSPIEYTDTITTNIVHGSLDINTNGVYTFTVPTGVYKIRIMVWGAGAGGGGYAHMETININREYAISKASGGGGGAGGHVSTSKVVTPGTTYTFKVGKGGNTAKSNIVKGIYNSDGSITWYDINENVILESQYISAKAGENGENSSFGGNIIAYGGKAGIGGTVNRNNGVAGVGGMGSPGGTTPSLRNSEYIAGNAGDNGYILVEGPKGPGWEGATYGFTNSAKGGSCSIPGAGKGGDGQRTYDSLTDVVNGQDGRVRIEW